MRKCGVEKLRCVQWLYGVQGVEGVMHIGDHTARPGVHVGEGLCRWKGGLELIWKR
jgi:hypothetical protein